MGNYTRGVSRYQGLVVVLSTYVFLYYADFSIGSYIYLTCFLVFQDKKTMLMVYGKQMGVTVDRTPKCHPEMAGEGIEYAWAGSKQAFRSSPLTMRRNKKGFQTLVRQCLDEKRLNSIYMRKCAARACRYMLLTTVWPRMQQHQLAIRMRKLDLI